MARAIGSRPARPGETRPRDTAQALLPGLTYLAREARDAGLDTVHDLISEALTGVLQWIEEEHHDQPHH